MTGKTCGTCRHARPATDESWCSMRPGYRPWITGPDGEACESHAESNWHRCFGTPARAAAALAGIAECRGCPVDSEGLCAADASCGESWLDWLEGDAR